MDPRQRPSGKEYYDQFRRVIAFLESSFAFIPYLDDTAEETTLEAKLRTICASMKSDKAQQLAVVIENRRLHADNERIQIERINVGHERDWYASECKRLSKDNENLLAQLNTVKTRSSVDRSNQYALLVEIPAQVIQRSTSVDILQAQLDAAQKDQSTLLGQSQEANKDEDWMSVLLQAVNHRADHLTKTMAHINTGDDTTRSLENLEHVKEELLQAQATINERDHKIACRNEELKQSKSQLFKSQAKIQEKDAEINNLEQRLTLMNRSNQQKETHIIQINKRLHTKDHAKVRQAERDRTEINSLKAEVKEQDERLEQLAEIVDVRDRQIERLSDREKRVVHEASLSADQLKFARKDVQDREHKINMITISLAHAELNAENYRERAEANEPKVKELETELERLKSRHSLEELQWQKFASREQVLTSAIESVVQWKEEMSSKMFPGGANDQDAAQ
ncbi:hypothetical protein BGZ93_004599 [Podila epicladia]|nr:hypothetical protein BGZ92_004250 [Podila epicladia]KAG0096387.1 hypothetical protein BGZ93_004599 [Podila epicladia]